MTLPALAAPSVEVREAWPQDQAFVAATFAEQLSRGHAASSGQSANRVVDRVLSSERTRVLIACEGKRIIGWLAYVEMPRVRALLFAYVRKQNRGQGVVRALAAEAWPRGTGQWVHGGLRGSTTHHLLEAHPSAIEMDLSELL